MKSKQKYGLLAIFCWAFFGIHAQKIALMGGEIHTGDGKVFQNATLLIKDGFIADILSNPMTDDLSGYEIISINGKKVYPGLIAPTTQLGLVEVESVRPTTDFKETGGYNPNVRTLIAYNTDSRVSPTLLSNGITTVQSVPVGGSISGTSSIFITTGWNWEDAVLKADDGVFFNWAEGYHITGWWAGIQENKKNEKYIEFKNDLTDFLSLSSAYCAEKGKEKDLKLDAMCGLFDGSIQAFINVDGSYEIIDAIQTLQNAGIKKIVISGGRDAYLVKDFLKENSVPVIYQHIHRLPRQRHDEVDLNFKVPKILQDEGILFCIGMGGFWEQRNLPFLAGTAVGFGLSEEDALTSVTLNTAKILSISHLVGSLEKGKVANVVVSNGDILDMKSSVIERVFVEGKEVDIKNHQEISYEKYLEKYNLGKP